MKTKKTNIKYHFFYLMIVSSLLFLCGFMFLPQNNTYSETKWTEVISTQDVQNFLTLGSGTAASPYLISTPAQLATLSSLISSQNASYSAKYYKLTSNIDLSLYEWSPIGTASSLFKGNFDGNGYVISGLKINASSSVLYAGLFGYIDGATIKNLSINNGLVVSSSTTSKTYAGGFVARAANSTLNNLTNLGVKVFSSATTTSYAGGIVGYTQSTNLSRVSNYSSVVSYVKNDTQGLKIYSYSGGIIGMSYGASSTVTYARNNGKIEAYANGNKEQIITVFGLQVPIYTPSAKPSVFAGGIIGEANVIISESFNSGEVISGGETTFVIQSISNVNKLPDESYAGGIAGKSANTITNVFNTGSIKSTASGTEIKTKESAYNIKNGNPQIDEHLSAVWNNQISYNAQSNYAASKYDTFVPTDVKDKLGKVITKTTLGYAGGIVGFSDKSVANSYNDGQVIGGGVEKTAYHNQYISLYVDGTGAFGASRVINKRVYYDIEIKYFEELYYGSINGNINATTTLSYGSSSTQNLEKSINVKSYYNYYFSEPFKETIQNIATNIDTKTSSSEIELSPTDNHIYHDTFSSGEEIKYIDDVKLNFTLSRNDKNAVMNLSMSFVLSYRLDRKPGDGRLTGKYYTATIVSPNYESSISLKQNINYSIVAASNISINNLGSSIWTKDSLNTSVDKKVNNGRPYLKNFYW